MGTQSCVSDASLQITWSAAAPFQRPPRWRRRKQRTRTREVNQDLASQDGTTLVSKVATTSRLETASIHSASGLTYVGTVEVQNPSTCAVGVTINSNLNINELKRGLQRHPDRQFVQKIIHHASHGVSLGYTGERKPRCHDSWPSIYEHYDAVYESIMKDIKLGRKMGPFIHPPLRNFVASPLGAFVKHSNKLRIIHDLSWPPGRSVNDGISHEDYKVKYISLDDITSIVKSMGPETLVCKLDLHEAFKTIPVTQNDWELLGSMLHVKDHEGKLIPQYYFDTVLPFGCRSSPKLFNEFADALEFIMHENGVTMCKHYLDDYCSFGQANTNECANNLNIMLKTCEATGFEVNYNKVTQPDTIMEYLGIIIDTHKMELRISNERLAEIYSELCIWQSRRSCNKRKLLSLIGKLQFVAGVIRPGRTFIRRMIDLSKSVKYLHYKVYLNKEFHKDLDWWLSYLHSWNGISMFYDEHWLPNTALELFTDASNIALGGYYGSHWFCLKFEGTLNFLKDKSINYRELLAIVIAFCTWCSHFSQKRILFHCDNSSVVDIINKGTSKSSDIMELIRTLLFQCALFGCELRAEWIDTKTNFLADDLSRMNIEGFKHIHKADKNMTDPVLPSCIFQKTFLGESEGAWQ